MTSNIEWGHNPDGRAEAPLYRAWARRLVHVSGMPWRIVADRIPARESRELLVALHTLGWTNAHLSRWLTSSDLDLTTAPKALYVTRLSAARIQATYDLLVSQPVRRHGRPSIPPVSSPTPAVLPQPRPNNTEPFQPALFELADCA